jgi:hypothetical protein
MTAKDKDIRDFLRSKGHIDADHPIKFLVTQHHANIGIPDNCGLCGVSQGSFTSPYRFIAFVTYRTVAYGLLPGRKKFLKWQTTAHTNYFIREYDINKKNTTKRIPSEGFEVSFTPLRKALSTTYLRSNTRKKKVNASRARRKGMPKRPYHTPNGSIRNGTIQKN